MTSAVPLSATVTRNAIDDLEQAAHWWQLPESDLTHVTLDIAHRGVGGCGKDALAHEP
ncbi:hypothetical protein [Nonomuraea basaltis]|uniref:hypothetical protein n=1 Tax=Nonomuraea basaltis TaxID=2495887 RepID=UPI001981B63A|nr:hypothetical protein [Nonomuraea basaltis]